MAIIHYEHYDLYGASLQALGARGQTVVNGSLQPGRTGPFAYQSSPAYSGLQWALPSPRNVIGMGAAFKWFGSGNNNGYIVQGHGFRFGTAAGGHAVVRVVLGTNGSIFAYRGVALIGQSEPGLVPADTWVWLEAKVSSSTTGAGRVEVRLNGKTVIAVADLSDLTDPFTLVSHWNEDAWQQPIARVDDWIVWDTTGPGNDDFIGDTFVIVAGPGGDGAPSEWMPSSGDSRWAMVDDAAPDDADYIAGESVGAVNEFSHVAVNLPIGSVAAIASQVRAFKVDSGASSIELGIASGSAASMSTDFALATGALCRSHIANLNPNGNVPWTQSTAQAARLRIRRSA